MKKVVILIIVSAILSALSLILGMQTNWMFNLSLLILMGISLVIFRNQRSFWLPTSCFSIYTAITIWGLLQHSSPFLLFCGELFAFITWELIIFQNDLSGNLDSPQTDLLIKQHIRVLGPVIIIAGIIGLLFLNIQFKMPFLVILFAGGMGIFGFFRFYRTSIK